MLQINDLLVSQEFVEAQQILEMQKFVAKDNFWTHELLLKHDPHQTMTYHGHEAVPSPLIAISKFEDGTLMIHNGHHRIRATWEVRPYLRSDEYLISERPLEDYLQINWVHNFMTPYDPRTHLRLHDFYDYKKHILDLAQVDRLQATKYIEDNKDLYCKPRTIHRVSELKLVEGLRKKL